MLRTPILLLGGSFNPAHAGHLRLSQYVLQALGIDQIWWLVAAQNPLKPKTGMAPYAARLARAQQIAATDARITVSDFEARHNTLYTIDTIRALQRAQAQDRFIWLMGADNWAGFHEWKDWQELAQIIPLVIIARDPPGSAAAHATIAAQTLAAAEHRGPAVGFAALQPPSWVWLGGFNDPHSASAIRAQIPQNWWE